MRKLIVCLIVLAFAVVVPVKANLLTNGDFEVGIVNATSYWTYVSVGSSIGAWTVVGEADGTGMMYVPVWGIPLLVGPETVHIGDSLKAGGVEQSFATEIGSPYEVSIWAVNWPGMGDGTGSVRVYWDNTPPPSRTGDDLLDTFVVPDVAGGGWTESVFTFTATETLSYLEILNVAGSAITIDDVSVTLIPEPATICLLGLGGLLLRRKR